MRLKIETVKLPDVTIVRCAGRITYGPEARRLQETLARLVTECNECVLNLSAVTQVDARGLGTLVQVARQARSRGASLTVANANGRVRQALRLTGVDQVIDIYSSEAAALAARAAA